MQPLREMSYMRSLVIIVYVCIHYIFMWSLLAMANSGILCVSMYVHCMSQDSKEGWACLLLFPALSTESLFCSGVACATWNVVLFSVNSFEISEGASIAFSLFHSTGIAQTCKVKYNTRFDPTCNLTWLTSITDNAWTSDGDIPPK